MNYIMAGCLVISTLITTFYSQDLFGFTIMFAALYIGVSIAKYSGAKSVGSRVKQVSAEQFTSLLASLPITTVAVEAHDHRMLAAFIHDNWKITALVRGGYKFPDNCIVLGQED